MKLNKMQKQSLRELKAAHKSIGGKVFSFPAIGFTIAIAPAIQGSNCNFVQFSIAQCSPADKFNKKRGQFIAVSNFEFDIKMSKRRQFKSGELNLLDEATVITDLFDTR